MVRYMVWRHHNLLMTGTFAECKSFLIKNDPENAFYYEKAKRGDSYRKSRKDALDYACVMSDYCSIRRVISES